MIRGFLSKRPVWIVIAILLISGMVASCNLLQNQPLYGDQTQFPNDSSAFLVCSATCEDQWQCGKHSDDNQRIFTNIPGVATQYHNYLVPHNSPVTIRNRVTRQLVRQTNGELSKQLDFYQVDWDGQMTWVAGWCVSNESG